MWTTRWIGGYWMVCGCTCIADALPDSGICLCMGLWVGWPSAVCIIDLWTAVAGTDTDLLFTACCSVIVGKDKVSWKTADDTDAAGGSLSYHDINAAVT